MISSFFYFLKYKLFWKLNKNNFKHIKLAVFDVDGVLTNGYLIYGQSKVQRIFNTKDGLGIKSLQKMGIEIVLISGGSNSGTLERSNDLKIKNIFFDVKNKSEALLKIQNKLGIKAAETIYLGDDLNDLVVKPHVKFLFATSDASKFFKNKSDLTLLNKGGNGAVRELSDNLLLSNDNFKKILVKGWNDKN